MSTLRQKLSKIDNYPAYLEAAWQEHLAPKAVNAPTVISTFAGCGGSSLGYSMAGFRELLAVEWDNNAVETFKLNFKDIPVYHGDIAKLSIDECLEITNLKVGELDVFDGSPPCQGFSTAGKRDFGDSRNQLFREYVRLLRGLRPKVFVMENVYGMVKGVMKLIFSEIMYELKASGYNVKSCLMNTMYFGVPQSRPRMIFIGIRNDININITYPSAEYRPISVLDGLINIRPDIHSLHILKVGSKTYKAWASICPGESMPNFKSRKKVDPQKPINTQGKGRPHFHWSEPREMVANEVARLGSFPDQFLFIGNPRDINARVGNSVPSLFMRAIAKHIRKEILDKILCHANQN